MKRVHALAVAALVAAGCAKAPQQDVASAPLTDESVAAQLNLPVDEIRTLKKKKLLSNSDLLAMPRKVLDEKIDKLRRPTGAGSAEEWKRMTMEDENGNIPPDAEMRAQMQAVALNTEGTAGGLSSSSWTEKGPGTIGGRVRGLAIHPTSTNTMLCGGVAGGIWRSTNGGASWARMNDYMANLAITTIVYLPTNANTVYAGTGEGFYNGDAVRGAGIFRSTNGGLSWTRLASTNNANFYYVNRISISASGTIILAATNTGIWRSINAGGSWTRVHTTRSLDVRFKPGSNAYVVAHCSTSSNALYSSNGGASWGNAGGLTLGGVRRIELAWSQGYTGSGRGVVYALKDSSSRLYRSTNGGVSYSLVSTNTMLGTQGWYDDALKVMPYPRNSSVTDDIVVAGGIDLWRSTNGGSSFTKISQWYSWPNSAHADQHAIVPHPGYNGTTNRIVYFGNDGGVWRCNDILSVATTSGWIRRNTNLGITQFYGASSHPGTDITIGGTQDNGTPRRAGGTAYNSWTVMQGGDGGFCASDPTNSNYHYGEYQRGVFRRSTNGGISASTIRNFGSDGPLFIAPFILDPNNVNRLLFGARQLWRSNNIKAGTPSWSSIKPSIGSAISAITARKGNSNDVWVGHSNGNIYRATNGTSTTPTWVRKDNASVPNRFVTRIVVDPKNSNIVYACFGGYSSGNIVRTTNGGTTWSALGGLPAAPIRDLEINPWDSTILYAATEVGLMVSENNGSTWTSTATPANVAIYEMFWGANNKLVLATHGRGMFEQTVKRPLEGCDIMYYRWDEGKGLYTKDRVTGSFRRMYTPGSSTTLPWTSPGKFGDASMRGSSPAASTSYNYVDTGWRGPLQGSFSMTFWAKRRYAPGTISYLFGNMSSGFRCFTGGVAGTSLMIRSSGAGDLTMPTVGATFQSRAASSAGVCISIVVNNTTKKAQWYVNGAAHGAAVSFTGSVNIPVSTTSFRIGQNTATTSSCAYDLDEFRLVNRLASAAEVATWCQGGRSLHYKWDKGKYTTVVNYGVTPNTGTMVSAGVGPWVVPGRYGTAHQRGSSPTTSAQYVYTDSGWKGPVQGNFTVHWWMKERTAPGTSLSYLFGGIGSFRCFTGGVAGTSLMLRSVGTSDLTMPTSGSTLQARAKATAGVCVGVTVDNTTKTAQWYVNGVPHGAPVTFTGTVNVPASTSSLKVGKYSSNTSSSGYDMDEFRFENYCATRSEIARWCSTTIRIAAVGKYGKNCGIQLGTLGGVPYLGNRDYTHTVRVNNPRTTSVLFVVGVLPSPPFDMGIAFPRLRGCTWYPSFDIQLGLRTNSLGILNIPGGVPTTSSLQGLHLDTQVLGFNSLGEHQSNAVSHVVERYR